jgi:hypothetical protein
MEAGRGTGHAAELPDFNASFRAYEPTMQFYNDGLNGGLPGASAPEPGCPACVTFHNHREKRMRAVIATLGVALLAGCSADSSGPLGESQFSGEASRAAEEQARQRCAAEGKRAQLANVFDNSDGSRRYEYRCVQ